MTLGIQKQTVSHSKKFAVIDYSKPLVEFSKVLTFKEAKIYKETGKLPNEVTVSNGFKIVEQFATLAQANKFIKTGKSTGNQTVGIFKSSKQASFIKKAISK